MTADLAALLPPGIPPLVAGLLVLTAAATSFITAALGVGGGVVFLAVLGLFAPPSALIPVHGVVQLGSNVGRTLLMWRDISTAPLLTFGIGSLVGAAVGGSIAVDLPPHWLRMGLGLFILFAVWGPKPELGRAGLWVGGGVTSFLTMFFGATGPLVATLIKALALDRVTHVATFSACMCLQHGIKIAAFGILGFAFAPWAWLLAAMIAAGLAGTVIGRHVLLRTPDRRFHRLLDILLTALALRLLWMGLSA
ncbi:sulfite exporter TauE/SafE family protein [Arhodomonas sp. SL1]|uniref:sulfite exporter TauE/SafE family protein n=1 Tax=Arhodomonas sp. SL1 TaxID=3425691 RepID=UPI003F88118E